MSHLQELALFNAQLNRVDYATPLSYSLALFTQAADAILPDETEEGLGLVKLNIRKMQLIACTPDTPHELSLECARLFSRTAKRLFRQNERVLSEPLDGLAKGIAKYVFQYKKSLSAEENDKIAAVMKSEIKPYEPPLVRVPHKNGATQNRHDLT